MRYMRNRKHVGVALVLALVVLSVLMLLGTPFVASMLLRKKQAQRAAAVEKLHNAAISLRNRAAAHLLSTHEDEEGRRFDEENPPEKRTVPGPVNLSTYSGRNRRSSRTLTGRRRPEGRGRSDGNRRGGEVDVRPQDFDSLEELQSSPFAINEAFERGLKVRGQGSLSDEQGKVNVNKASFLLLANIFGSSHLKENVDKRDRRLELFDADIFPSDNDPRTIDGLLVIHNTVSGAFEAVTYRHKKGDVLLGVIRGELLSIPAPHAAGSLVMDARALKIFLQRLWGNKPQAFGTLSGLRQVNNWSIARFFADHLWHYKLSKQSIPRSAVIGRVLALGSGKVDTLKLQEAERALLDAGLDTALVDDVERYFGEQAVIDYAESLKWEKIDALRKEIQDALGENRETIRDNAAELKNSASHLTELMTEVGVEALTSAELTRVRDLLTVYSEPAVSWSPETQLRGTMRYGRLMARQDMRGYLGAGSIVRLQSAGSSTAHLNLVGFNDAYAAFERPVPAVIAAAAREGKLLASSALPASININTAPYSVIVAAVKGVRLKHRASVDLRLSTTVKSVRDGNRKNRVPLPVTGHQARRVADKIWESLPLHHAGELAAVFVSAAESGIITPEQSAALRINSVNPLSEKLWLSTTSFCYTTGETYGFSFLGAAQRGTLRELARLNSFEVFKVAPPRILNHIWDTQADFSWRGGLSGVDARGGFLQPFPGRSGNLMATYGDEFSGQGALQSGYSGSGGSSGSYGTQHTFPRHVPGVLTSTTARLSPHGGRGGGKVESFSGRLEGEVLLHGRSLSYSLGRGEPPFAVDFYLCPLWTGGSGVIPLASVSMGRDELPGSTITFTLDQGLNELILRLSPGVVRPDAAAWGAMQDAFVGARYRLNKPLVPDTWYHLGFVVNSVEPGGQCILLDGRAVGHGNISGTLQGSLPGGSSGGSFSLREEIVADNLPAQGPLWVGNEVVYCRSKSGNGFSLGPGSLTDDGESGRGCRGTPVLPHSGSLVKPVGYRVRVTSAGSRQVGVANDPFQSFGVQVEGNDTIELGRGGATLEGNLAISKRVIGGMPEDALNQVSGDGGTTGTGAGTGGISGAGDGEGGNQGSGVNLGDMRDHRIEKELLLAAGSPPKPLEYTYPLIVVVSTYQGKPMPEGGENGELSVPGGTSGPGGTAGGGEGAQGGAFYPVDQDVLPVPVDPVKAGFPERGILRVRYRFGTGTTMADGQIRNSGADGPRNSGYDRLVEYTGIGKVEVPGDASYPAFTGVRDIGQHVFKGHNNPRPVQELQEETRPLRQLRIYGISIPASGSIASSYPNRGVIQIQGGTGAVFPQLRDVEWISYTHIYRNYFMSAVEYSTMEDNWETDPALAARNDNNKILRGFCGAVTLPEKGSQWAENFDGRGIGNHAAGATIQVVYGVEGALPGAGDGVYLSPLNNLNRVEQHRIHKKAETDLGAFLSFHEPLERNYSRQDVPVIRRFPEPYYPSESTGNGQVVIGPSPEHITAASLNAIVDEVRISSGHMIWSRYSPFLLRSGSRRAASGVQVLSQAKNGESLQFIPFNLFVTPGEVVVGNQRRQVNRSNVSDSVSGRKFECLYHMGGELVHLRGKQSGAMQRVTVRIPPGLGLVETDKRFSGTGSRTSGGNRAGGAAAAAAGSGAIPDPVFFPPNMMRQPWSSVQVTGGVSSSWANGGYLIFPQGFGGREIWSFEGASGNMLTICRRGVLGSAVALTPYWEQGRSAYILPYAEVEVLRGGILDSEPMARELSNNLGGFVPNFPVADGSVTTQRLVGELWKVQDTRGGYVRIDDGNPATLDRVVAYHPRGGALLLYDDPLSRRPLFYGSFGTKRGRTSRGTLIDLPVRYYDRYELNRYSKDMQHFTRGVRKAGAFWRRLSWEHGAWMEGAAARVGPEPQIRLLLRFNGTPAWHTEAVAVTSSRQANNQRLKPGNLYLLSDPVPSEGFPLNVIADEVELRVLFYWPPGAYSIMGGVASDTWKVAPRLRSVGLEYQDRGGVLHHEEFVQ